MKHDKFRARFAQEILKRTTQLEKEKENNYTRLESKEIEGKELVELNKFLSMEIEMLMKLYNDYYTSWEVI